jgi:aminocarboxymuconate-semialdehyde decarboxylase
MRRGGLDKQVLLPPMSLNGYQLEPRPAQAFCRLFNETNAAVAQASGGRLIAAATVPMQSSPAALEELEHAVQRLAIPVVALSTNVNGKNLDEDAFQPFFKRAAELGTLVVLHPHDVAASDRLGRYYLTNLIGNPLDTAIAAASLIFGGALERYASLNVCLVHGGGVLPYLLGRVSHGYRVAKACGTVPEGPEKYVRMLYYDTLVHDARALRFLSDVVGPDRLMLGTDYPYEMGEDEPWASSSGRGWPSARTSSARRPSACWV